MLNMNVDRFKGQEKLTKRWMLWMEYEMDMKGEKNEMASDKDEWKNIYCVDNVI